MTSLQNAFEFTDEDIAANRDGKITEWQKRRLKEKQSKTLTGLLLGVGIGIVAFIAYPHPLVKLLCLGIFGFLVFTEFLKWQNFGKEIEMSSTVYEIKGFAAKRKMWSRYGWHYTLELAGTKFTINNTEYDAVDEGMEYRAYFGVLTKTIFSIEPFVKQPA